MRAHFLFIGTGLAVLFLSLSIAFAPPNPDVQSRFERWNDMWLGQTNRGTFGPAPAPCDSSGQNAPCIFPGGSDMEYLDGMALWVGALIDEEGFQTPRVSVAFDGWFTTSELFPPDTAAYVETSLLDTVNCAGESIYDPTAIADHEFSCFFTDTMRDAFWVEDDPIDGSHRPLGLKITRTTYAMRNPACDHIQWIKYHIENIGSNFLKNIYIGHFVETAVRSLNETSDGADDLCGYLTSHGVAWWADNDGRAFGDTSGTDFVNPNATGMIYQPVEHDSMGGITATHARESFNWWVSNGDPTLDYGPAWEAYCDRDSLDMGWTGSHGTPLGDAAKYGLMKNRELDFCQAALSHPDQIPPQIVPQQAWWDTLVEFWCMSDAIPQDVHRGTYVRKLYSVGPVGVFEYRDAAGNYVYRLNPGESFDCWAAIIGGLNLHDVANPQTDPDDIDIGRYNFMDMMETANSARDEGCLSGWPQASATPPGEMPQALALSPLYPNPFNTSARISFAVPAAGQVTIRVYDVLGREAAVVIDAVYVPGRYQVTWNAQGLASGIYFVQANMNGKVRAAQKAVLLK